MRSSTSPGSSPRYSRFSENVPDDYRRRQTLKNAERYITPELKAFEDRALSAQERALAREKVLYEGLVGELAAPGGHQPERVAQIWRRQDDTRWSSCRPI